MLLWQENLGCYAAPKFFSEDEKLPIEALMQLPLLHASAFPKHWDLWLDSYPDNKAKIVGGNFIDSRSNVLKATCDGIGVSVLDVMLTEMEVNGGGLTEPFSHRLQLDSAYWMLSSPTKRETSQCRLFKSWIQEEVQGCRKRVTLQ